MVFYTSQSYSKVYLTIILQWPLTSLPVEMDLVWGTDSLLVAAVHFVILSVQFVVADTECKDQTEDDIEEMGTHFLEVLQTL